MTETRTLAQQVAERRTRSAGRGWGDHRGGWADRSGSGESTDPTVPAPDGAAVAGPVLAATATFGVTSLITLFAIALLPTAIFGWTATVIESSSMQPSVVRGDIVVLRPTEERVEVGAVVRFPADDGGTSIVHRVVAVDEEAGAYITRGDANRSDDRALVPFDDVDGLATMLVPFIGHPSLWVSEGRYLTMAMATLAGLGVIGAGTSVGRRRPDDASAQSPDDQTAPIVADTPLGRWSAEGWGHRPVTAVATLARGHRPNLARPRSP